ncbi:MAG TPA: CopD family protein [Bryobacteraceae bacterium]|nr:CopD family protein [Bryobacteraceae bacterium]
MTQFLDIFGFLSVLLRGFALTLEALTVGGVIFEVFVAREHATARAWRWIALASMLLAATQVALASANGAILIGTTDLTLADIVGAEFFVASLVIVSAAIMIALLPRNRRGNLAASLCCIAIISGSTMMSHGAARVEGRWLLMTLTLVHHAAGAAWIGGLPYLLFFARRDYNAAPAVTQRFSKLAMVAVAALVAGGAGLAFQYVGSAQALGGTIYGIMLASKIVLTAILLLFGALNRNIVKAVRQGRGPEWLPLARFVEAEIGIGFTVLLAAASLTSTPPATDVLIDRVTPHEIVERMTPRWPRLQTPRLSELSPAGSLVVPQESSLPGSFVPGESRHPPNPADIAWSEYNHHWAGFIVLTIGVLAVFSRRFHWARHWPLAFFGLALFLLIRSDAENWPLGPRGFWESFQVAEVAQHRVFVLLIVAFAIFEWAVQTHRLAPQRAGLVFPFVCSIGGALLMTHSHSLGNVKEEFLAELSHIPLALLAVVAGWSRWLEIRLPGERTRLAAWIWPVCFVLIGTVLILYRES